MRGLALALPGFIAFAPEWLRCGAADAARAIPAPESALRLRPRRAVSSTQVTAILTRPLESAANLHSRLDAGAVRTQNSPYWYSHSPQI
jgi:hypothetical protein